MWETNNTFYVCECVIVLLGIHSHAEKKDNESTNLKLLLIHTFKGGTDVKS